MGLGSGIRKKPNPDPGSRGQKGAGSRIRIRNTEFRITDPVIRIRLAQPFEKYCVFLQQTLWFGAPVCRLLEDLLPGGGLVEAVDSPASQRQPHTQELHIQSFTQ